ncbi:MAG: hypothetical protein ALECFALPRED_002742 [Alectoria fallacina]|uniref:Cytochrome P450 n=1 Tax=Alectoria fallacina TaxID=1903189 RepID=A0A8H3FM60_9LECA|nr:MAG: hypothetical protein ALECFALPRED_002742 [Alectoria fallacina]
MHGLVYLFAGASVIEKGYLKTGKAEGKPFFVYTPGKRHVMVTSNQHIKELNEAPSSTLSLHAVAKDFLQPKHTMRGFEWKSQRGIEGTGFVRAIRTLLTSHLPVVKPALMDVISGILERELNKQKVVADHRTLPLFATVKQIVNKSTSLVFFGDSLSQNQEFLNIALQFSEDVFLGAEILRMMPGSVGSFIARLMTRGHRSSTILYDYLYLEVERRLEQRQRGDIAESPNDGIQWLLDTSPKTARWDADRLVGEIMGVWYGSIHTLAIASTYAVIDLYSHRDYIEPLRKEVQGQTLDQLDNLPLLDAFLKESARVSAFESTGIRREALTPFTFSDGLEVSVGEWICVPHRSMMRDSKHFDLPLEFNASRFFSNTTVSASPFKPSRLVDASEQWLVWGSGRILWYAKTHSERLISLDMPN